MLKEDEILKEMFKSIDVEIEPPDGVKQIIYQRLFYESNQLNFGYTAYLSLVSEKLFKLVIPVWILVSILMTIFTPTIAF